MKYRKSLVGIEHMVIENELYFGLPEELKKYHYYLIDAGHVIMCIPNCFRQEALKNPDKYETGIPVKYVLSHPYTIIGNYVYIDVPYAIDIPDEYTEF